MFINYLIVTVICLLLLFGAAGMAVIFRDISRAVSCEEEEMAALADELGVEFLEEDEQLRGAK